MAEFEKPQLNLEELANLEAGQRCTVADIDCRGLSSVDVARCVGTVTSVGFEVRMLGNSIGRTLQLQQTNKRNRKGELLGMQWEVVCRGDNA